ncbi:bifunctional (p)ppGpp synthetase/guanosine-3',5'-bis(diphosphate) 3'-pyrophosphohydrolase [Oscillibacter sp.]|jgi:guanosine-3',5'-bis(diphosphate) 3'-pyrophosphohydrolase|uniref:RelA/SpoT family protein n=2 Tax=Oscillibacter TaxID=459786 RepID=UPI002171B2F3|nr:bifunctional (p)ppGpp synthetase/guanosine-3',5'-bis(diphosphate) 3'-pyrophosphohydrolase [Oscillibacter sp.]MCI8841238.1 bifunctional (p)ppGpp synthetase/guanosine-3',5'-bis(diphosphate) 3'-pyrophosphohydrolase [Oscillibacter sp.]MCI9011287.1 bifunctional (p)ppGpp synthetase/guanosine-3',5'-bis(diphosphate) 3'-pyrophosphohydrolase [Oscillibacter sp.]MCI9114323.1 bifunctional (p)ppGpp synthetase/guanosine-3',5'-bis(diphosphate) 3'-pyrophosphohydrolase [Oscillibacter sp.]MCI9239537.1 bifuncti
MTVQEQYELLEKTVRGYNPAADFDHIRSAFEYADRCHEGQKRKSGEPYIIHPLAVAQIVAEELKLDSESIEAALLHDVIEDTPATHGDVARMFSPTIANLVEGVSKLTRIQYATKEDEQMENLRKMLMAMSKDIRVILIKVSDRLHNMRTMEYQSPEKQKQKSLETMEIYAPISHRLGMQRIKWELEDLSLKYLDPVGYEEIITRLDAKKPEYDAFLLRTQTQMDDRLTELGIQHMVYGRIKHPYSIYRKMFNQNKSLDEIFDLFAFRVLVDTVGDCYNVLGVIHDIYKPIPGRFKDYIGTEKPNGYQSLHTTVIGPDGLPFEVQIRTWKMHEVAEYGVAAHWKYKQHGQGAGTEGKYEWVRRLLENQEGADAEEYIHSLKVDMFADEVFVFTPNGDVQNLPAGATPIDFAYAIHSAVGNRMVGAKVNNRIVTFDHILKNGDIVEIMTSKSAKGPSRDWMKIAKSSEARSKIRQWFKKEKKEENIANGRSSFEQELKHAGLAMKDVTDPENLPLLLKKVTYGSLEEMYAAIGYGGFTAQKAVSRMKGELLRIARQHQAEELTLKPEEAPILVPAKPVSKSEQGIIVEGLDNCLVKFSRCCTPVPGDEIVGFITRGYGVSVHRADCPNAAPERRAGQEGRWLKVSWGKDTNESYPTTIDVMSKDRMGLILDISTALSSTNTFVSGLNSRSTEDGFAVIRLEIRVRDGAQMKAIMNKLNQISGVLQVTRPAG